MLLLQKFILFSLTPLIFGWQTRVLQENVTLEYVDKKVILAEFGVYKFNETIKALNVSITPKIVFPDDTKLAVIAYKWLSNDYRLGFFEIRKTFKSVTEMEMFDLQSFFVVYARPPMVWPLEKGVTYRSVGWVPDSSKFPSNTPSGKYKFKVMLTFGNNTKIMIMNYYTTVVYK